jgi:disulfide bond formation protein DsbB
MYKKLQTFLDEKYTLIIFLISFTSVIGSLYFSDVLLIEPCYLCWWQRIFMYPLFLISLASLIFKTRLQKVFILALAIPGFIFAVYHYLMQTFGIFKEFSACTTAAKPCDVVDVNYFGFITIPFLSLLAFTFILFLVIGSTKKSRITFWKR